MARISLQQVVVDFPVVNAASQSLQLRLYQALGGKLTSHHRTVVVRALDGLDLELKDGDRLGLIGHNGSARPRCFACSPAFIHRQADQLQSKAQFHPSPISRSAWIPRRPAGTTSYSAAPSWG